jgi:Meiosis protein SPO22/ZIP4 like
MLERVALYVERSTKCSATEQSPDDEYPSEKYLEYVCLRIALVRVTSPLRIQAPDRCQSWQQDRLDLAEHFFSTADFARVRITPTTIENMVDLLLEIGSSLLHKGCCDMAVVWLRRARELLEKQHLEELSLDAGEMRMNLLHTYGQMRCARTATFPSADLSFQQSSCSLLLGVCRSSAGSK